VITADKKKIIVITILKHGGKSDAFTNTCQ